MVVAPESLASWSAEQLRDLARELLAQVASQGQQISHQEKVMANKDSEIQYRQARIEQLTHEMALLKRWKFGKSREQLDSAQPSLLDETLDADIAAIEQELQDLAPAPPAKTTPRQQPKRAPLPPELPRRETYHEPDSSVCTSPGCGCSLKRIGQDICEKLDYTPGIFTVERHIRGKWACAQCQTLSQAPVPTQVIDKGIPPQACWPRCW